MPKYLGASAKPECVHWEPDYEEQGPGIITEEKDGRAEFISWKELRLEIERKLLPQVRVLPLGCTVQTGNLGDRVNWIVKVLDPAGKEVAHLWFGSDGDAQWKWDGMVRIGEPKKVEGEIVWQTFQRWSDGSYRRISARRVT